MKMDKYRFNYILIFIYLCLTIIDHSITIYGILNFSLKEGNPLLSNLSLPYLIFVWIIWTIFIIMGMVLLTKINKYQMFAYYVLLICVISIILEILCIINNVVIICQIY